MLVVPATQVTQRICSVAICDSVVTQLCVRCDSDCEEAEEKLCRLQDASLFWQGYCNRSKERIVIITDGGDRRIWVIFDE